MARDIPEDIRQILRARYHRAVRANARRMCFDCGTEKSVSDFHFSSLYEDGMSLHCKACHTLIQQVSTEQRAAIVRARRQRRVAFGLTANRGLSLAIDASRFDAIRAAERSEPGSTVQITTIKTKPAPSPASGETIAVSRAALLRLGMELLGNAREYEALQREQQAAAQLCDDARRAVQAFEDQVIARVQCALDGTTER